MEKNKKLQENQNPSPKNTKNIQQNRNQNQNQNRNQTSSSSSTTTTTMNHYPLHFRFPISMEKNKKLQENQTPSPKIINNLQENRNRNQILSSSSSTTRTTMENYPLHFRCPISMEVMKDPVAISTGVTYERKNIEKWFHTYNKKTCPATMQTIDDTSDNVVMTPNHTLKSLILEWQRSRQSGGGGGGASSPSSSKHGGDELASLLSTIETTPFKVNSLKKLRTILDSGDERMNKEFKNLGGVEVIVSIIQQILSENSDFLTFRACEEAVGVLHKLMPLMEDEDEDSIIENNVLLKPELIESMALVLQRGSADARFCTIATFVRISSFDPSRWNVLVQDQGIEFFKSLLEIVSDDCSCTRASSYALQILIDTLETSKKARLKATEAGGVCTLIELLPDASGSSRCEKIMYIIKLLCDSADGRLAFADHGLGVAAVAKKMLNVSTAATKIAVKIFASVCGSHPPEKVLEEMLVYGAVTKLVALLHIGGGGGGTTRDRVVKILKMCGNSWKRYSCFPCDVKEYLVLGTESC